MPRKLFKFGEITPIDYQCNMCYTKGKCEMFGYCSSCNEFFCDDCCEKNIKFNKTIGNTVGLMYTLCNACRDNKFVTCYSCNSYFDTNQLAYCDQCKALFCYVCRYIPHNVLILGGLDQDGFLLCNECQPTLFDIFKHIST